MSYFDKSKIVPLDVRPTIESGKDPFKEILNAIKELPENGVLQVINSFEPLPMINHLSGKGFLSKTERPEPGIVHTYFFMGDRTEDAVLPEIKNTDLTDFEMMVRKFGIKTKTIDVRQLEMPEPMVTILQEVEILPEGFALFVYHKRMPQFLLPELKKRNFEIINHEVDQNNMNLLIYKKQ